MKDIVYQETSIKLDEEYLKDIAEIINSESIVRYLKLYKRVIGKVLTNIGDVVVALYTEEVSLEDIYFDRLEESGLTYEEENYWEDNMEAFEVENYFPPKEKKIEDGGWIKIRTEVGYEVHFAKKAKRMHRWKEKLNKITKTLHNPKTTLKGIEQAGLDLKDTSIRMKLGWMPYEVFYFKTKTQKAYLMPYQYEVVEVEELVEYVMDKVSIVKVKSLYTALNSDVIFYMRQRGIPKDLAILMSNLKQCYFTVNIKEGFRVYNDNLNKAFAGVLN